jgi:hypothetical protein
MDRVEQYRGYIKQLLTEYASYKSLNKTIERQFVCDTENDHYQIVNMGSVTHERNTSLFHKSLLPWSLLPCVS